MIKLGNVGVVIRTKDRPMLLERAIRSVFNQSINNIEIVVVNDGGDQNSVNQLVEKYQKLNQIEIKAIHNQISKGMEAASNLGIKSLNTKYITLLDDDDTWDTNILKIAVKELEKNHNIIKSIMGVSTLCNIVYETINCNEISTQKIVPLEEEAKFELQNYIISLNSLLRQNLFTSNSFLYYHEAILDIGYYREDLPVLGDWEFNIRFAKRFDILIIPHHLAYYHKRVEQNNEYDNSKEINHQKYYQILRNQWLREELNNNHNLGFYTNTAPLLSDLTEKQLLIIKLLQQMISLLTVISNHLFNK